MYYFIQKPQQGAIMYEHIYRPIRLRVRESIRRIHAMFPFGEQAINMLRDNDWARLNQLIHDAFLTHGIYMGAHEEHVVDCIKSFFGLDPMEHHAAEFNALREMLRNEILQRPIMHRQLDIQDFRGI